MDPAEHEDLILDLDLARGTPDESTTGCNLTLGLVLVLAGCKATPPGDFDRAVASFVKRRVTVGGRDDPSPLAAT